MGEISPFFFDLRGIGHGVTTMHINSRFDSIFTCKFNGRFQGPSTVPGAVETGASDTMIDHRQGQETEASEIQESGTVLLVDDDRIFLGHAIKVGFRRPHSH
jgi:hypothetical protein